VPLDAPLNPRRFEVLRCINGGCPGGHWTDFTYKTTANALQARRLVSVSKTRRHTWKARVEPAGIHYLDHGDYPAGYWQITLRRISVDLEPTDRAESTVPQLPKRPLKNSAKPKRPPAQTSPDGLTPTRKRLKDILDAGGILERDTRGDKTSNGSLVAIINRRQIATDVMNSYPLRGPLLLASRCAVTGPVADRST
jgi:hypothetical protein